MPTSNFNLPLYTRLDTSELDVLLNGQSTAIDVAMLGNIWEFHGTEAQRIALATPKLRDGITFVTTDTKRTWLRSGGTWMTADASGYLVSPVSVAGTGVTIATDGSVVFTNSSSITVNGVFTSRFKSYDVVWDTVFGSDYGWNLQFCSGGTPDSGASSYKYGMQWSGSGAGAASEGVSAQIPLTNNGAAFLGTNLRMYNPGTALRTTVTGLSTNTPIARTTTRIVQIGALHDATAAYDGFKIYAGGTGSGTLRVYGNL